ncbi:MAG: YIP1 family protein [Anaerolineae bacterium]|nr:YIP1 family protein [Anaerolineae bacterium]
MDFSAMIQRGIRAARLDKTLYAEVEGNAALTQEAVVFVVIVSIISAIGGFLSNLILGSGFVAAIIGLIVGPIIAVVAFFVWAFLNYWVGTNLFKGKAEYGELIRTLGYAYGPNALGVLSFIPCLGGIAALIGAVWMAVAGFFAIRQALEVDDTNAILTIVISFVVYIIVLAILGAILAAIGVAGAFGLAAVTGQLQ